MNAAALMAAKAYGAKLDVSGVNKPKAAIGDSFSNMVANQINNTIETSKAAETQAQAAVSGKADLVTVVTAISAAEVQMETMVAFRDQAIQAYQEITRMPI